MFSTTRHVRKDDKPKRPPPPPPPPQELYNKSDPNPLSDPVRNFASQLRESSAMRATTEPYVAYGGTEKLLRACSSAICDYTVPSLTAQPPSPAPKNAAGEDIGEGSGWWFQPKSRGGLGLDVTFNNWAQVVFLHMYICTVRLRYFPKEHAATWHQNLLDHFFYAAEERMAMWHGMSARGVRNKYLKDLWTQWRGCILSYDEGLIKGDAVLGSAVWRNVFKASEHADVADVALVTSYMRQQLKRLDGMDDGDIAAGNATFSNPAALRASLGHKESPWMRKSFTEEELQAKIPETKA